MSETTFQEFKENFMPSMSGYVPTYFSADEQYSEVGTIKIEVEMICPFRMTDGPSRFFKVQSFVVDKQQYEEFKEYAKRAGEWWANKLTTQATELLNYSNNFKEYEE